MNYQYNRYSVFWGVLICLFLINCSPRIEIQRKSDEDLIQNIFIYEKGKAIKLHGSIKIVQKGEKQAGLIDIFKTDSSTKVLLYTFYGSLLAEIRASQDTGIATYQDRRIHFKLSDSIDSLGITLGRSLTFKEFFDLLCQQWPSKLQPNNTPDSSFRKKGKTIYQWKDEASLKEITINRSKFFIEKISYTSLKDESVDVQFQYISNKRVKFIKLSIDSDNYIFIDYD